MSEQPIKLTDDVLVYLHTAALAFMDAGDADGTIAAIRALLDRARQVVDDSVLDREEGVCNVSPTWIHALREVLPS